MRIVGGKFKGHSIAPPSGAATRPTSDRVRESIFNILAHGVEGLEIEGARVLDLFAGTGAMGLEAISRGAKFCQFVDDATEARGIIRRNADQLGVIGMRFQTGPMGRRKLHTLPIVEAGFVLLAELYPPGVRWRYFRRRQCGFGI